MLFDMNLECVAPGLILKKKVSTQQILGIFLFCAIAHALSPAWVALPDI